MARLVIHTPVCDLLGVEYPILLAGMGSRERKPAVDIVTELVEGGFTHSGPYEDLRISRP